MANNILAARVSFSTCLCMRSLLGPFSAEASCLIRLCNNVRASDVTGVTGVIGVCSNWSCEQDDTTTSLAFGIVSSTGGLGVYQSTLSGLNGNNPVAAHPAVMFLLVNALSLAGLYREVKCSLPIITPPRSSRSASSR